MTNTIVESLEIIHHPLDLLQRLIRFNNNWIGQRSSEDEMVVAIPRRWCNYVLHFVWQHDMQALQFTCHFDFVLPEDKQTKLYELLKILNQHVLLGHFGISENAESLTFRYTLLLAHEFEDILEQLQHVIESAIRECERYYPAVLLILYEGRSIPEALAMTLEVEGEG